MANRFNSPNQQFFANPVTGAPLAGGFLYFYASGTSTPQNTYSDSALTVANLNPVVLDSNGYANSVFLSNLAYKAVLTDSNNIQLWTFDPVWSSDFSTYAQFQVVSGNPNGQLAGVAGTPGALPGSSVAWDYINDILYVCTTTGTAGTAVWTAVNPSSGSGTAALIPPGGRLTPTSGTPVINTNSVAATSLVYTPYIGSTVPIYNGTVFNNQTFTELTLTLASSLSASVIYDVFVFNNSGVLTLVTGPAWSVSTAGSGARGTGSSTTQISRLSGFWVNAVSITGLNGVSSYTIPANQATYLGSILIDTTPGQVSCLVNYGQSRKFGIWNAYNRVPIILQAGDSTASWSYSTATIRPSDNNTANSIIQFTGLAEENFNTTFQETFTGASSATVTIGIGFNSTTAFSGYAPGITTNNTTVYTLAASLPSPPALGVNVITCLEKATNATTFDGTNANMVLQTQYRG